MFIFNPCTIVHNLLEHNSIMKLECKKSGKGFNRSYIIKIQICDHIFWLPCDNMWLSEYVDILLPEQIFHNSTSRIDISQLNSKWTQFRNLRTLKQTAIVKTDCIYRVQALVLVVMQQLQTANCKHSVISRTRKRVWWYIIATVNGETNGQELTIGCTHTRICIVSLDDI